MKSEEKTLTRVENKENPGEASCSPRMPSKCLELKAGAKIEDKQGLIK